MSDFDPAGGAVPITPIGEGRGIGPSVYDAKNIARVEEMVAGQIERDKKYSKMIAALLEQLPDKAADLLVALEYLDYRYDLMKKLLEGSRDKFFKAVRQKANDFSPEASEIVNGALTQYLCLIMTAKDSGQYTFGSTTNSYANTMNGGFDPYRPDLKLDEVMEVMHDRQKYGATVDIIFPIDYNFENLGGQATADAKKIIHCVDEALKNNPSVATLWKNAGYTGQIPNNHYGRAA